MKHPLPLVLAGLGVAVVAVFLAWEAGVANFAADVPHAPLVTSAIEWLRDKSIARAAGEVAVPADLTSPERIRRGAGNYAAMCASCHLSPGEADSEIRKGLYPQPPNLAQPGPRVSTAVSIDARRFWVIKHGIKGSGMPAWALGGMGDDAIWDLTAFLAVLPGLDATAYRQQVARSDGHSHEGMHAAGAEPRPPAPGTPAAKPHTHKAGGPSHVH